jgi:hypothetical protein
MNNSQLKLSVVPEITEKNCSRKDCQQINPQPLINFGKNIRSKLGLMSPCKTCIKIIQKKRRLKFYDKVRESEKKSNTKRLEQNKIYRKKYNKENPDIFREKNWKKYNIKNADGSHFKVHDYDVLVARQKGLCAICGTDKPCGRGVWHIDHNHETGIVRGALCLTCNAGLGGLKDSVDVLKSAIKYLEEFL